MPSAVGGGAMSSVPPHVPSIPNDGEWPQRLRLLAETAVLIAHQDRAKHTAAFRRLVKAAQTADPALAECTEEVDVGGESPLLTPSTLTPASFLCLLCLCVDASATRAKLRAYAEGPPSTTTSTCCATLASSTAQKLRHSCG